MAKLRAQGRSSDTDYAGRSLKGQLTQAQRLGAATVVIAHERGFTVRKRGEQDVEAARVDELAL
jgi:histidyl-tRNA synthetase